MIKETLFGGVPLTKEETIKAQINNNKEMIDYLREKMASNMAIFIPGNTPSLKNSKEIGQIPTKLSVCHNSLLEKRGNLWYCTKCNQVAQRKFRTILRPSKTVMDYQKATQYSFNVNRSTWFKMITDKDTPHRVGFYFIRKSMHEFDYQNIVHVLADMMVSDDNKWLKDDSTLYFMPEFLGFHHNPEKPGCIITLYDNKLNEIKNKIYPI